MDAAKENTNARTHAHAFSGRVDGPPDRAERLPEELVGRIRARPSYGGAQDGIPRQALQVDPVEAAGRRGDLRQERDLLAERRPEAVLEAQDDVFGGRGSRGAEALEGAEINDAKIALANAATALCHGAEAAEQAAATARRTFGEGAAGVIDLRSRPATGTGELNLQADVSLMTAGLAMDQRVLDDRAGWMLSGRRSYLDWLSRLASRATDSDASFPYGFTEVAGQVDLRVGSRHTVEGSWLWEGDELTEGDTGAPLRATWGNALGRASWTVDLGPVSVQHTVGGSSHRGRIGLPTVSAAEDLAGAIREPLGESLVQWAGIRGTLWPEARSLAGPEWSVGYALELHHSDYFGPQPLPVPRYALADRVVSEAGEPISYSTIYSRWSDGLMVASLWGERTWTLADRLSLRTGLRIETGEEVRESEPVRVAPRLSLRYSPLPELALSVGAARVHQYAQAVSPTGIHLASLVATDAWVVAGSGIPAVTADHGTAGFEAWVAPGRVFTLNGFARRTTGVALPDPAPGPVFGENRLLVAGETVAYGLEASVRQLTGPVTGSASYSLSRSRTDAAGRSFPSGADRTHVLNATAMTLPLPGLRVGAAFTAATGVPFTRTVSTAEECADLPGCDPGHLPWAGSPNGLRAPTFASLDLLVDWSTEVRGLHLGIYGQIRNVLGRENATIYTGTGGHCLLIGCSVDELRNAYERGVPRLPVVGIRVRR